MYMYNTNMYVSHIRIRQDRFPTQDVYPYNLEILQNTRDLSFNAPVTFFVGENGTGKSTLLQAIARACSIYIWKGEERRRRHINRFEEDLYRCLEVEQMGEKGLGAFFASEIFRYFAQILDEWAAADPATLDYFGSESLMEKSHGQSHMAYFQNRFLIPGLYLLDEPENALSPRRQLELVQLLHHLAPRGNVQFIIATHSPILMACHDAEILSFDHVPIRRIAYEETDYYQIYRNFFNDRSSYLPKV
jgi:predicted ATPase